MCLWCKLAEEQEKKRVNETDTARAPQDFLHHVAYLCPTTDTDSVIYTLMKDIKLLFYS